MPASTDKYDIRHLNSLLRYEAKLRKIYYGAIREISSISSTITNFNPDKPFSFKEYPVAKKRIDKVVHELQQEMNVMVTSGIDAEWTLSNNKNSELTKVFLGNEIHNIDPEKLRSYFANNKGALEAFKKRKIKGLGLSQRIWRYTNQFKQEMEMGIDLGLRKGQSADEMSRNLRSYLRDPNKLFRKVRDQHGELQLSKNAKAYKPGRGKYRSSYKNARRFTATEINMAYRESDHVRWSQLDFVLGIEVKLSNNHTLNGKAFVDVCDHLKGKYPKGFKFIGWHILCRCYATAVLIKVDDFVDGSKGEPIKQPHPNFKKWVKDNKGRISKAKNLPYFLRDNKKYWNSDT